MKVALWNNRGIGRKSFWPEIDSFCKIEQVHIMAIVETKTDKLPSDQVWRRAGFDNIVWSPADGRAGGVCLMWKEYKFTSEHVEILVHKPRYIIMKHVNLLTGCVIALCFLYAPPEREGKR